MKSDAGTACRIRVFPVWPPPGAASLQGAAAPLDPEARDYVLFTQVLHPARRMFNGQLRAEFRRVQISGVRIVIEQGGRQGLFERLMPGGSPAADLEAVDIYADEVVIAAALHLPGSTVRIFARTLSFEDRGAVNACIATTPLAMDAQAQVGAAGANGEPGGDIFLFVQRVIESSPSGERLALRGGQGQQGGPETPGAGGRSLPVLGHETQIGGIIRAWNGIWKEIHGELPPNWQVYETAKNVVWFQRYQQPPEFGHRDEWPEDGKPGQPGGVPGIGGRGGTLHCPNAPRRGSAVVDGGPSASARPPGRGGALGEPELAVGIWIEDVVFFQGTIGEVHVAKYHFYSRRQSAGLAVASPGSARAVGESGAVVNDIRGWLHPSAARMLLAFAEDNYRIGRLGDALGRLTALQEALENTDALVESEPAYLAVRHRVNALLIRIASNLDFFGHEAGWVPALDFAVLFEMLEREVNVSGPLLVTTEQVRQMAEQGRTERDSLTRSRDRAATDLRTFAERIAAAATRLPALQAAAATAASEEAALVGFIAQQEQALLAQAVDLATPKVSFLKQALRTLGAVATVLPVGQPVVGAIGAGLGVLSSIDEKTPWATIQALPSVARGLSGESIKAGVASYKNFVDGLGSIRLDQPAELFKKVSAAADVVGKSLGEFSKLQQSSRAPSSEIDAIFQRLKSEDPRLNELVDRSSALAARKSILAQSIDSDLHELGEATSRTSSVAEQLDVLNRQLISAQDSVDHSGVLAAQQLANDARARLDNYHYLFSKAYEYFAAKSFPGNLRALNTAANIAGYIRSQHGNAADAASAFQKAYVADLRAAGALIVQSLAELGTGVQKSVSLTLDAHERARVNEMLGAGLTDQPRDLFLALSDRNIAPASDLEARLVDVEVSAFEGEGGDLVNDGLSVELDAGAQGTLRSRSGTLTFRYDRDANVWGASVDLTTHPRTIHPLKRPEDIARTLGAILDLPAPKGYTTNPPLLPGLWLRLHRLGQNAAPLVVRELTLTLTYSTHPATNVRAIHVACDDDCGGKPLVYVSAPDLSGAQHGYGSFTRVFGGAFPIKLIAQAESGGRPFAGWYGPDRLIESSTALDLPLVNGSFYFRACYGR